MMKIGIPDLQLDLEKDLQVKIERKLNALKKENLFSNDSIQSRDRLYYSLLSRALPVSEHYAVKYIIERLDETLGLNVKVSIYLYQSTIFEISCFPRKTHSGEELIIFVNQYFFNNLNEDEQVGIIGHEIAHYIFNHFRYPVSELLKFPLDFEYTGGLKVNLVYWAKIKEITSDIIGLVANGFNNKAYSTGLIKHFTGLHDSSQSKLNISPIVNIAISQYDRSVENLFYNDSFSTHPSWYMRVKIINIVTKSKLIKNFGENISNKKYIEYKNEYNKVINEIVRGIYPELFTQDDSWYELLIPLSMAVILADGDIHRREVKAFKQIIEASGFDKVQHYMDIIFNKDPGISYNKLMSDFVAKSVAFAKKANFSQNSLVPLIRVLLLVAASDERIDLSELECIYSFVEEFGFTREDLVTFIATQYKI